LASCPPCSPPAVLAPSSLHMCCFSPRDLEARIEALEKQLGRQGVLCACGTTACNSRQMRCLPSLPNAMHLLRACLAWAASDMSVLSWRACCKPLSYISSGHCQTCVYASSCAFSCHTMLSVCCVPYNAAYCISGHIAHSSPPAGPLPARCKVRGGLSAAVRSTVCP
jgi:hypothetical protein